MDLSKARLIFFDESREQCDALESALLDREQYPANLETYNLLFRTAHTIKGSAGVFGLEALVRFAHVMENVLERLRSGQIQLSDDLITLLLQCNDHLRLLLDTGETDEVAATQDLPQGAVLLRRLMAYQAPVHSIPSQEPEAESQSQSQQTTTQSGNPLGTANALWQLSLRFHADTFRHGFDPLSFVTYLQRLGSIRHVETVWRAWPQLANFDPTECFLGLEIALESDEDESRIRDTFEFVQDDSFIGILPPHASLPAYHAVLDALQEREGEDAQTQIARWQARGALTAKEVQLLQDGPIAVAAALETLGADTPPVAASQPLDLATEPGPALERRTHNRNEGQYVRIEAAKLDRLINRVGELVIAASGTTLLTQQRQDAELMESVAIINSLVESIRDDALTLRMVPVGDIFGRFPRMVRETAQLLGKEIRLDIKGADTEIDKSMVEKLADPLMHIVRNAVDHGLESTEARRKAGKPAVGVVTLNAYHDSGAVVVEIRDDGGGINRERVLDKAIQRGLVAPGVVLSDQETLQLIFLPGFSTADKVSDLSGRGVGMDVVKRNIELLRGVVEIESHEGVGSVFRLRLPLTLAIIDGFRVEVDDVTLVMPLDTMIECVDMPSLPSGEHAQQINVRGNWLPYVSLRKLFGLPDATGPEYVVIVHFGSDRAGIVVDRLLGEVQAVIKPLGDIFKSLRGISGSTILGNGRPGLVLDVAQLIRLALQGERRRVRQQSSADALA